MESVMAVATLAVERAVGRVAERAGFDSSTHTHGIPTVQPEGRWVASTDRGTEVA